MTDVLVSILILIKSTGAAASLVIVAMLLRRFLWRESDPNSSALEYFSATNIAVVALLVFVAEIFVDNTIAGLRALSWVELLTVVEAALNLPILYVGAALAYREARLGNIAAYLLNDPGPSEHREALGQRVAWPLVGFLGLLATLLLVEHRLPYYFTQDDNLAVNLPEILLGCRSLFHGVFPTWNPFQYMGSPNTTLGWYALTYPATYFSYAIAKTLLGNENLTLEVFAFFHLLLGYFALYWAIRREGCRPSVAMLGSSCSMLSGYALIFSRSWFQFSPVLLWMPLLILCVQSLVRGGYGWKWILAFGAVIGTAFHAGHIQMWIYSVMLADLAIILLIWVGAVPLRAIWASISAHFFALAIAAPLLIPEYMETINVLRRFPDSRGISRGIVGLFVPSTVQASPHPIPGWVGIGQPNHIGEMYYSGTLFMVLAAVLLISLLASRWTKRTATQNLWFICALFAFLLALGDRGVLWTAMMHLPGFKGFRFPFKFLAYVVVFVSLAGSVALERILRNKRWALRVEVPLAVFLWAILGYHATLSTAAFFSYGFKPFPAPKPILASKLISHDDTSYPKLLPIGGETRERLREGGYRSAAPDFMNSYMNQWPTVWGAFSIDGYNPMVSESPTVLRFAARLKKQPERALYEYGVQYVLQYDTPELALPRHVQKFEGAKLVYESPSILLQELPKPRPMSFLTESPDLALPVRFDGAGATIRTSDVPRGGQVILNMLWRSDFRATEGDKRFPVVSDDWGRIAIQVPPGVKEVRVSYRPRWEYGFLVGFGALVCGLLIGWRSVAVRTTAVAVNLEQVEALV